MAVLSFVSIFYVTVSVMTVDIYRGKFIPWDECFSLMSEDSNEDRSPVNGNDEKFDYL